jgi:hypothetical protein
MNDLVEQSLWKILSVLDRSEDIIRRRVDLGGQNTDGLLNDCLVVQRLPDQEVFGVDGVVEHVRDSSENKIRFLQNCEGLVHLCKRLNMFRFNFNDHFWGDILHFICHALLRDIGS